jgi:glycosyltransferase involved in cell wall biosynthesis
VSTIASAPRLSIVIATWNAERTFERCIASITKQTFKDWELLISDGGSTDGTVDLIKSHGDRIAWSQSRKDRGIYDAWNQALAHAKGEYVCFLGADDEWVDENSLATIFDAIGSGAYDLVTSRGRAFDPSTNKSMEFGAAFDFRRLGRRMVVCHPGMLHRRELFDKHGLFDTDYRIAGDLEFLLRLPENLKTLDLHVVTVRIEAAGISRKNVLKRLREQRIALSRCERYGPLRANIAWLDKLWRYPIARLFGISH